VARNRIEQLLHTEKTVEVSVVPRAGKAVGQTIYIAETSEGERIAIVPRGTGQPADCTRAIRVEDATSIESALGGTTKPSARWLGRRHQGATTTPEATAQELACIRSRWPTPFAPAQERYEGDVLVAPGLRPPQIGALYAILGHWTASQEAVTVVMPTGSGKTDTMVSLLVAAPITGLLVLVPSDPLREQTVDKFKTLGVLTKIGLVSPSLPLPVVATMKSAPRTVEEVQLLCASAHVIVATDKALSSMNAELLDAFVQSLSHLFVDEAHHVGARTWRRIKQRFVAHRRPIVQFTATPFRNDGKRVDGRHIYTYPLRRAQDDKLFKPVIYEPVHALSKDRADEIIARKAAEVLDRDLAAGLDHLAMARCDKIERAEEVLAIYRNLVSRHRAELVHNKMPKAQRRAILEDLKRGAVRIIVCVKMLGEGFDLPRLKIAALHDPQQSEAPTLQFIGRFTRVEKGLGDATVIAAVASHSEKEWLANLYKSDADWNHLLRRTSGHLTETERRREDLFRDMVGEFAQVPIETITPKLSCRIFKLSSDAWHPDRLSEVETSRISVVDGPIINHERALVMATLRSEDYLDWTRSRQPVDVSFRLIMAHYHEEQQLLYVSTTGDDQLATRVAQLIGGEGTTPVGGESVFRVLHGFRRAMLTSLGVKETDVKPVRFQMSSGIDIVAQLDALADNRTRIKTNLFATGFVDEPILDAEEGYETQSVQRGIGCSTKGKIWAADKCSNPGQWIDWCRRYGSKIVDESIGTAAIMRGVLRPKRQEARPLGRIPISVDWPEAWLDRNEDRLAFIFEDGHEAPFSECDFAVAEHRPDGPIPLEIRSKGRRIAISFDIVGKAMAFTCFDACRLRIGSKEQPLQVALQENPPSIRFTDGAFMQGLELAELTEMDSTDFDADTIATIDWTGVDLKAESLGPERNPNSVQGRVIRHLNTARPGSEIIFDGDVSGEIADVIELQRHGRLLDVHLYHCKYMLGASPGGRINELYEVCGQAMKSVRWANPGSDFLKRMLQQEERRLAAGQTSRFIKGDRYIVERWISERGEFRTRFHVTIVQPGYSKSKVDRAHLPVLGSLRAYLMSTYAIDLAVWTSP
jgi:superfamily II DNA or RNA helicase